MNEINFVDTHCHLEQEYYDDIDLIIEDNIKAGVDRIIVSGCNIEEIKEVLEYSVKYECVYLTVGFHPEVATFINDQDLLWLEDVIKSNSKIVGLGEIGLDYHYEGFDKNKQIDIFNRQLLLAEKYNLPVVIHSRDATKDTIDVLEKYNLKGDIHCFSGSLETAKKYISMGYLLGIGGVVTFKNSKLREVVKNLSLSNILLETDSPYLSPVPYRGVLNSSKNIPIIAEEVSRCFNVPLQEVASITTQNAIKLFHLK